MSPPPTHIWYLHPLPNNITHTPLPLHIKAMSTHTLTHTQRTSSTRHRGWARGPSSWKKAKEGNVRGMSTPINRREGRHPTARRMILASCNSKYHGVQQPPQSTVNSWGVAAPTSTPPHEPLNTASHGWHGSVHSIVECPEERGGASNSEWEPASVRECQCLSVILWVDRWVGGSGCMPAHT